MRLALIAHGNMPIPSDGWGAVESILWNHKIYLERAGHTIDIFNSRDVGRVLQQIQRGNYDFVHCHNEFFVLGCAAQEQDDREQGRQHGTSDHWGPR